MHFEEELLSEVILAIKDFTGSEQVKAGLSHMAGSPVLGLV